ncbi:MAG TPA: hypothetical protein VFW00_09805, partial [Rhodocyclaceae bacterium]|nr:hypothetical protein [Rhodocyclaceae bacterium]
MHVPAHAASAAQKRGELQSLQEQIRNLQQDISRGEENRGEAADDLADSERAISDAQRRLRDLASDKHDIEVEIARLQAEHQRLDGELASLRKQLGETLYRFYVENGQAGTRRLLSGDDPNQLSRDTYYLQQIAKQRSAAIDAARLALQNLQSVLAQAEARRAQLAKLESERTLEQQHLFDEREKRQAALAKVADKLRAQRREMASKQRDQARLE